MIERRLMTHLSCAEDLTAELDDDRIGLGQPARISAMLVDVDDLLGDILGDCFRLVRRPLKLAVELSRAVVRIASSRTRPPSPASCRR